MTRRFRLVLSGAFALLAAVLCALYGQGIREEADRVRTEALERYGGEVVTLVVATKPLEAGDVVDQTNTTEREWLADLAPQDAVTDLDEIYGSELTVPASSGAPLTALNFRNDSSAIEVPSGKVALQIPLTEKLGLPAAAQEGSVLAAYEVVDTGASLVAQDVEVLRVAGEQTMGSRGAVTLAVNPDQVSSMLSASAEGSLRLALPADDVDAPAGQAQGPSEVPAQEGTGQAAEQGQNTSGQQNEGDGGQ